MITSRQHCANANTARHSSLAARVSAHYVQNCADDIRLYPWPITSVLPRHLFTDRLCSLRSRLRSADNDDMIVPRTRTARTGMVRAVSASSHLRFGTCCHLISKTVVLVANSSSRALRLGSLCKPTHKRRLWGLLFKWRFTNARFDWLIDWTFFSHGRIMTWRWLTGKQQRAVIKASISYRFRMRITWLLGASLNTDQNFIISADGIRIYMFLLVCLTLC